MLTLLTLLGIIFWPELTLGCVLIHYDHPLLGIIAIVFAVLSAVSDSKD